MGLIMNMLSFRTALYQMPLFFKGYDTEVLFGEGVQFQISNPTALHALDLARIALSP